MATLASLPTEVFNQIAGHLPRKSQLLLRQCSKGLHGMSDNDLLFKTQRYYHSIIDFQSLVAFATDPAHTNARRKCKTLVIDTFSPRSMKIRCKVETDDYIKYMKSIRLETPRLEKQRIIGLLTTALDNLPNLECIEFTSTTDTRSIPIAILQAHYPSLGFDIRGQKAGKRFLNAYCRAMEYEEVVEDDAAFSNTMEAVARSSFQPKGIHFSELTDLNRWEWIQSRPIPQGNGPSVQWFRDIAQLERLQPKLRNLRKLELPIGSTESRELDASNYRENVRVLGNARPDITRFLEMVPNVEELRLKVGHLIRLTIPNHLKSSFPQPFPINPVDVGSLKFSNLRVLSLFEQAFVESELRTFLTSHKDTLRKVELNDCVLHSEYQIWSGIFKLLETVLSLWSFEFQTGYPKTSHDAIEQLRIVPWFRVYGNVRTPDHRCELFPKDEDHENFNKHRISFRQAMQVVARLEDRVVLGNDPELDARRKDTAEKIKGISPHSPVAQSQDFRMRLMMLRLSARRDFAGFNGIQPKDVQNELVALGVQGFDVGNKEKLAQISQPNTRLAALQITQLGSAKVVLNS